MLGTPVPCGKYVGRTYGWMTENAEEYITWAKSVKEPSGWLVEFVDWVKALDKDPIDPEVVAASALRESKRKEVEQGLRKK